MAKIPYVNIDKIKELCKSKGLTMKFLSDNILRDKTYFSNIRSGKTRMDDDEVEFIANALETTVEYLTDQSDQKEKPTSKEIDVDDILKMMLNLPREKKEELLVKFMQMMKEGE